MGSVGRLFLGIEPTPDMAAAVAAALPNPLPGRTVPPENWHLTVRFLADVDVVRYEGLVAELDQADLGGPIRLRLGGLGAFPNTRRATVLWMGLDRGAEALADLAGVVEEVVVGVGFEPEDRPFRAHLTLARIRPPQSVDDLVAELQTPPIEWRADHLTVFRSHLGRGGARYEVLDRLDL